MSLLQVFTRISASPSLCEIINFSQLGLFVRLIQQLRERLSWTHSSFAAGPPTELPDNVCNFIAASTNLNVIHVNLLWTRLSDLVWGDGVVRQAAVEQSVDIDSELLSRFARYGQVHGIGCCDLYPPTRICFDPICARHNADGSVTPRELDRPLPIKTILFSRDLGPLPVWAFSFACRRCNTRYYPNYYVHHQRKFRSYYSGVPSIIQVTTHSYVERTLCEHFSTAMVCAWVSASNNARIYNTDFNEISSSLWGPQLPSRFEIDVDKVWTAFFLNALLLDHHDQSMALELLDYGASDQAERLRPALETRNASMVGPGQENWNHACDQCCAMEEVDGGARALRAVVTDGITIGHPCCSVHDCKIPLPSQRARFCTPHASLDEECAVLTCHLTREDGHPTCTTPEHRALERHGVEEHTAMFQLRNRLRRINMDHPEDPHPALSLPDDAVTTLISGEQVDVDDDGLCPVKPDASKSKLKARFGRQWTFAEELCVACCGVILGRATFYGSEGPNGVRLFLRTLFPTSQSVPGVMFYDNNCHVKEVIMSCGDVHFDRCAMPVDVFHMKTKHKESHEVCNRWCNPAGFPDLMIGDKWRFNSSAAEITNAWFGGFQSIVREMRVERYEFFLDEMIKRRNRILIRDHHRRHVRPYSIPRADLLGVRTCT